MMSHLSLPIESRPLRMSPQHVRIALVLSCVLATLPGCKQDAGSAPAPPVAQVEVITVTTQTVPDEPEFIGQAEASRPVEIRSQVTGLLKAVLYPEGRDVKKATGCIRSIRCRSRLLPPVRRLKLPRRKPSWCRPIRIWNG